MNGKYIERFFTGDNSDADRELPKRPQEEVEEENRLEEEFFNSLTKEQQDKYVDLSNLELRGVAHETKII